QFLPVQSGMHLQSVPSSVQVSPELQRPQAPPQPSSPHNLPSQSGRQTQFPRTQVAPPLQASPQTPPQPSSPHSRPSQSGSQPQSPSSLQLRPSGQSPQLPPQPSSPQALPSHEQVSGLPPSFEPPSTAVPGVSKPGRTLATGSAE